MAEYFRKEYGDLNEVASDNNDDKDDDDDANSKDVEVVEIGTCWNAWRVSKPEITIKVERNSLVTMKDKLKKIRVLNKNQSHINDYFMLE